MGEETNPFEGAKVVRPNKVAFSKVGDYIIGYYYGSKDIPAQKGGKIKLYEVRGITGQYHFAENTTDENGNKLTKVDEAPTPVSKGEFYQVFGGKDTIDGVFAKAKLGQKIGLKFGSVKPSKTPGHAGFKEFETYMWEEVDPDFLGQGFEDVTDGE